MEVSNSQKSFKSRGGAGPHNPVSMLRKQAVLLLGLSGRVCTASTWYGRSHRGVLVDPRLIKGPKGQQLSMYS